MIDLNRVTNQNPEAIYFLAAWGKYLRHCDDAADDPNWTAEHLLATFALGATVYSSNFYRRHAAQLGMAILICTNLWGIANGWELDRELWKRQQADVLRNADIFLANAVAQICCGWHEASDTSRALLASAYIQHLDKHGPP